MGFIEELKDTLKSNKKTFILIVVFSIIIGLVWSFLQGGKKEWTPPRDINREYQGEIIQKILQGQIAPGVQDVREGVTPQRREQIDRGITPPPANEREFAPRENREAYSDF